MASFFNAVFALLPNLIGTGPFILGGLFVVGVLEARWPARRSAHYYRRQLWADLGAFTFVVICSKAIDPAFGFLSEAMLAFRPSETMRSVPPLVKLAGCVLLGDFLQYWVHRGMHSIAPLWRTHRWHHEPALLNALAGYRGSVLHRLQFGVAALLIPLWLFDLRDPFAIGVLVALNLAHDLFIHANLPITLGPLGWLLASPAWHRIHHARDRALQGKNLGGRLTIWDRMFGTFVDVSEVEPDFAVGVEERPPRPTVMLGL